MAKGVVEVQGKDVEVREDTFKAYRGARWAIISIAAFAAIVAIMFLAGVFRMATDKTPTDPSITSRPAQ
jgi:hypothetical protein